MTNHLINLIAKAAHDLDYSVTMDFANALAHDDHIEGAVLPLHTEDLAETLILHAGYLDFEDAAEDLRLADLQAADDAILRYAR